jgi:hypothetical protein
VYEINETKTANGEPFGTIPPSPLKRKKSFIKWILVALAIAVIAGVFWFWYGKNYFQRLSVNQAEKGATAQTPAKKLPESLPVKKFDLLNLEQSSQVLQSYSTGTADSTVVVKQYVSNTDGLPPYYTIKGILEKQGWQITEQTSQDKNIVGELTGTKNQQEIKVSVSSEQGTKKSTVFIQITTKK